MEGKEFNSEIGGFFLGGVHKYCCLCVLRQFNGVEQIAGALFIKNSSSLKRSHQSYKENQNQIRHKPVCAFPYQAISFSCVD